MNQSDSLWMTLAGELLELASDEFSNHGCNDWNFPPGWSIEQKREFVRAYHAWNGDQQEYDENRLDLPDNAVMSFLADWLRRTAEEPTP